MSGNAPEKSFRIGALSASVFLNTAKADDGGEARSFRSVSLQRRYRDGETWKSTTSFRLTDLPTALTVLQLATDYVTSREATESD